MRPGVTPDHLPSLDGLRAVSIVLVLAGHLTGTRNFVTLPLRAIFGDIAHLGVVVFFIISGFLITSLLLKEEAKTGRVSLKLFYARRALRIFPAAYAFLLIVALLSKLGAIQLHPYDLPHSMTYTVNYAVHRSWYIGHLWSLSVEEQFYLLWPWAFWLLGSRRAVWVAGAVILLGPAARLLAALIFRGSPYRDLEMFPMVADSLAAGCWLACFRPWLENQGWYLRLLQPGASLLLVTIVLAINRLLGYTVVNVFGMMVINLILAVLIHRSIYYWDDRLGALLNARPVAFCGVLSYSLYLWQQLFLNRNSESWTSAFPQNILLVTIAALLSYHLLEKPLMAMRHRLRAVRSS